MLKEIRTVAALAVRRLALVDVGNMSARLLEGRLAASELARDRALQRVAALEQELAQAQATTRAAVDNARAVSEGAAAIRASGPPAGDADLVVRRLLSNGDATLTVRMPLYYGASKRRPGGEPGPRMIGDEPEIEATVGDAKVRGTRFLEVLARLPGARRDVLKDAAEQAARALADAEAP